MAPKKTAAGQSASPKKSSSPMKGEKDTRSFVEDPHEKAKAYKAFYATQDPDQLRDMCKNQGIDHKGTKSEMVERLSRPAKNRARSGSPVGRAAETFSSMTKHQEWAFFGMVAAVLALVLIGALLFHSSGGDFHKFLDFFGAVGQKLKSIVGAKPAPAKS